ncbi:MAG TPA: hypothetical protein VFH54_11145 [Mycobacteriales bacterium]|nr:hypothetical protein [Mycobacteriales bacterium]
MPSQLPRALSALASQQDWVLAREQILAHGLTRHAITHRLRPDGWQILLPSVYLCHPGEPSRRQLQIGALLYAGDDAAVDAADACRFHGVKAIAIDDDIIDVLAPWGTKARSRGIVRVRRTLRPFGVVHSQRVRYVEASTAVIAAARRMRRERSVVAALSDAVQRRIVTPSELLAAHALGSPRNAQLTGRALEHIAVGIRSPAETDARVILEASNILPKPIYNCLLRLPCGRLISPDALIVDAGLVHETNGRAPHARDDLFEDMQERHDVMTAAGLTVLHNSPRRLWRAGPDVLAEAERCYVRLAGRGLPPGVEIVRLAA